MISDSNWYRFDFDECSKQLTLKWAKGESGIDGEEALELWEKIRYMAAKFPEPPTVIFSTTGR
jgi:hypothetical protein